MCVLCMQKFSSFGRALDTCFAVLLGDISVLDDLHLLTGLQGLAGTLFFWSFELLVFMVLLNFLLAIIVDAFSEVKDRTAETLGSNPRPHTFAPSFSHCTFFVAPSIPLHSSPSLPCPNAL